MSTLTANIIADFTTALATELSVGATTATLSSATDDDGTVLPTGRYFFTLDGSNSAKEHISCFLTGTALTNIKSVSRQGVETVGAARKHRIGAVVSITDFSHILQINNLVRGVTNLDSSTPLKYDGNPIYVNGQKQIVDWDKVRDYADGLVISGAPDASTSVKGIVELATQTETDSKTTTGDTGALLVATPNTQRSTLLSDYKPDTGVVNAYVITPVPAITAYAAGQIFSFKAANGNTSVCTLNVNNLGVKAIFKGGGATNLTSGDIIAGQIVKIEYDGTNFQMLNPSALSLNNNGDGSSLTNLPFSMTKTGIVTRIANTASGAQVFAHGLGKLPKILEVIAFYQPTGGYGPSESNGYYDGTTTNCVYSVPYDAGNGNTQGNIGSSTSLVAVVGQAQVGSVSSQQATASFDATNITLNWTLTSTGGGMNTSNITIMWRVN